MDAWVSLDDPTRITPRSRALASRLGHPEGARERQRKLGHMHWFPQAAADMVDSNIDRVKPTASQATPAVALKAGFG